MESVKPSPAPSRPSKKRGLFLLSFAVLAAVLLLCFPEASAQGALQGLTFCLGTLLPSTFPFLVLSAFCVQSGLSRWLEPLFAPVTRTLFSLPGCCGPTILLGLLGGYPAGVRGIAALYRQGSVTAGQAARMLGFCVNAGPAFTISVIGAGLYGNLWLGCLIFFSVSGASLLLGILLGGWDRLRRRKASRPEPTSGSLPASAPLPLWGSADCFRGRRGPGDAERLLFCDPVFGLPFNFAHCGYHRTAVPRDARSRDPSHRCGQPVPLVLGNRQRGSRRLCIRGAAGFGRRGGRIRSGCVSTFKSSPWLPASTRQDCPFSSPACCTPFFLRDSS